MEPKRTELTRAIEKPAAGGAVRALWTLAALSAGLLSTPSEAEAQSGWAPGNAFDALIAGAESDGRPLRVCRSTDGAFPGRHPGKIRDDWGACAIGYGTAERQTGSFETLRPVWVPAPSEGAPLGTDSDGTKLSVCRGPHAGGLHVGKKRAGTHGCAIAYGGAEVWLAAYEVLTAATFALSTETGGQVLPRIALLAGYEADRTPLYACLGAFQNGWHPGKTRRGWGSCAVSWGGQEQYTTTYQVVVPHFAYTDPGPLYIAGENDDGSALGVCTVALGGGLHIGKYHLASKVCYVGYDGNENAYTDGFLTLRSGGVLKKSAGKAPPAPVKQAGRGDIGGSAPTTKQPPRGEPNNPSNPVKQPPRGDVNGSGSQPTKGEKPRSNPGTVTKGQNGR